MVQTIQDITRAVSLSEDYSGHHRRVCLSEDYSGHHRRVCLSENYSGHDRGGLVA